MFLQKSLALTLLLCATALAQDSEAEWLKKVPPGLQKMPGFAYVKEDPTLPRVLLIGDSISIGYTPNVREHLKGQANVLRIPRNGSSTNEGLQQLDGWIGSGKWDVIHANWGLHDLKRMKDGKLDSHGELVSDLPTYEKNLRALLTKLKATGAKVIWAQTTPVPEATNGREPRLEEQYNAVAAKVCAELGVTIDDLWGGLWAEAEKLATKDHPEQAGSKDPAVRNAWLSASQLQRPANVHYSDAGSEFLGTLAAKSIQAQLKK